jgi:group I intron endonuclease
MAKEIICGVYKITSPIDKVYIGQSVDINHRFKGYKRMYVKNRGQTKLHRSFKKYGVEIHRFEIIEECIEDNLNCRERYWQDFYDVINNGLNCRLTKDNDRSGKVSKETLLKMSKASMGNKHWLGKTHTQETKDKISIANKGRKHSLEVNKSKGRKGHISPLKGKFSKDNPLSIPIVQLDLNGEFIAKWDSLMDVKRQLGLNICNINSCIRGKLKTSNGFKWKYLSDYTPVLV